MLEKSCRWWPIWYLLFCCNGAEGQLQWDVKEKVTAYGQNLILFCPVVNCCSKPAGWFVGPKTIILDVEKFSNNPKVKYHGTYDKDGFGVVIRNLSVADLNVTYRCIYGIDQSTPKYLLHDDVFRGNDKEKENDTAAIVVPIVVIMVGFIIGMVYCVYRSRIKKNRPDQKITDEEREALNNSDISTEHQQVTDEEREALNNSDISTEHQQVTDEEREALNNSDISTEHQQECIEVEIIQKGPISVGYGGTININANIIPNSTGSLEVNWQKIQNDCSRNLMINCPKYFGSSCQVNNPHLTINDIGKEDAGIYKLEVISSTETKSSPGILMELCGDEADSLSKEENNFVRLYFLCQKIATTAVRLFFDSKVPGYNLKAFLMQHKSNLTSQFIDCRCTKEQVANMFPGGQVAVVSTEFDFSLLYKLIRNLLIGIPAPTCGWGKTPSPRHVNETDDIERIRYFRNILSHNTELEISDAHFFTYWTDLSQAINRLSKGSFSRDVESMRTNMFDRCIKNEMAENMRKDVKEIREEIMELGKDVTECKTDIADNKHNIADHRNEIHNINTRNIPPNIRKSHVELIKKWKIDDKPFFDETRGVTAAFEMVHSKNYMTIIGGPGSGKTATARHIALQLEKKGWEVVPMCKLEDIIEYGDRDHKQVFVLDDVLGIFAVEMNTMYTHKEMIITTIGQTSKLLLTCRKSLYKEVSKLEVIVTENVIDLESEVNQLTDTEKMAICQHHCKCKGVNQNLYASLSFTNANHMFPFLCKIFSQEKKYQQLGESFFNKPYTYFNKELDKLQHTHTIQYAVLVLCLLNEGKLSVEHLPNKNMQIEVFNYCGVNIATSNKNIKDAIKLMSETYFTQVETEYTFTHDFMFEAIAYHYGCQYKPMILKYLSSSYIANKVTVYHQALNEDLCIHISGDMYMPLAERLYRDIKSMNLFDVFMNKSLKHGPFRDFFEKCLKEKPIDEFELLILRQRHDIDDFVVTTFSTNRPTQQIIDSIGYERLFLLFELVFPWKSHPQCIVKVISWIINYGHTHLLQEIVNHVKCNNLSISLVFGSDIIESTRLLLLGCHSKTLDMVELILTYIDPKCIDRDLSLRSEYLSNDILFNRNGTPLTTACAIGSLCIVNVLLRKHADINKCNHSSESPLFIGSSHGHMDIVKCLLSSSADINMCNTLGQSPLLVASLKGHCDVVKCLLSSDADINLRDEGGQSPLLVASLKGHCDVVKCLLSSDADINGRDEGGYINLRKKQAQLPLFVASQLGHCAIVKCLLSYGANINLCSKRGQSPLFAASKRGHCDVVKCLLSFGADIKLCDEGGRSPLFAASHNGRCEVVKCLLSSGADINLPDADGRSPLLATSKRGHCDVVICLLNSGADINLRDRDGQSPFLAAVKRGYCDVYDYLRSSGADTH